MSFDLIVRNGLVVDGTGRPRYQADVGVAKGRIAKIGDLRGELSAETIDASGNVVTPGFIDGHTHMDAQIFWDPLGTSSCWHGVTSVIMGNCGFTLAPCGEADKHFVMKNLERAEDISREAMNAGIKWSWETFPEYLDAIERLPKGINYGAYIGHSALRTYVMRERAFSETATDKDIDAMRAQIRTALAAGAIGFTTSRQSGHKTADGGPVASVVAGWEEVEDLVGVLGESKTGVFELAKEDVSNDSRVLDEWLNRLQNLAVKTRVPTTFGLTSQDAYPDAWRRYQKMVDDTIALGGRMAVQSHSRAFSVLLSFETNTPFDRAPIWSEFRKLSLAEQEKGLRNSEMRAKLVDAAHKHVIRSDEISGAEARQAQFDSIFVLDKPFPPYQSVGSIARERGKDPVETMIDIALERDLKQFFQQVLANENQDHLLEIMKNPHSVVTFSDSGAHVSQIMDSSLQTHFLGYWVREKQAIDLEAAIRKLTFDLADFWNLRDRGQLREGAIADITVFNPDEIAPLMPVVSHDLPTGVRRLTQKAKGIAATVVSGKVLTRDGEHTGLLPGTLLRTKQGRDRTSFSGLV